MLQKMEVLPVSDLDVALHNFVNKDEKMAFYSCVQYNLEETRVSMSVSYVVVTIIRDIATFHFSSEPTYCYFKCVILRLKHFLTEQNSS